MPVVEEKIGQVLSGESAELNYIVRDVSTASDARIEVLAASPGTFNGLPRLTDAIEVSEQEGTDLWFATVRYVKSSGSPPQAGDSTFSFETRGGTQHISQSLQTVSRHAPVGITAPDFKGAIGATDDSVEGVDITVPVYAFTETHFFAPSFVDAAYKGVLFSLTGKVNNAPFKSLAAGECLFLGAAGTKRGDDPWEISFAFAGSPNVTGLSVGDITGIDKKGWEYLWIRYEMEHDAGAKMLVRRPLSANVERVYETADFSLLGIGTT